jgi:hypothetical protein
MLNIRRQIAVFSALCTLGLAPTVLAETTLGVFVDAGGTHTLLGGLGEGIQDLYVYLYADQAVEAVAYSLDLSQLQNVYILERFYGPDGTSTGTLDIDGEMVDLGGCQAPDATGKILIVRYSVLVLGLAPVPGYRYLQLGSHGSVSGSPSYRPCGGSWTAVELNLASLVAQIVTIVQPAPGDVVEAGSLSSYVFMMTSPLLIGRAHEVSVDGGQSWELVQLQDCTTNGETTCLWRVPSVPTQHARVRLTTELNYPDPNRPGLEFVITGTVETQASSWSSVKARFGGR